MVVGIVQEVFRALAGDLICCTATDFLCQPDFFQSRRQKSGRQVAPCKPPFSVVLFARFSFPFAFVYCIMSRLM